MKKKRILLSAAVLGLLLGVVACGGGSKESGGGESTPVDETSQTKNEKITINAADNKTKLIVGDTVQLTASVDGVAWESKSVEVATVDASGLVKAVGVGSTTITASKDGYKNGTITIKVELEKITVTAQGETSLLEGQTVQLKADQEGVSWKSSDEKVATVDASGLVTAVAFGTAEISAEKAGFTAGKVTINVVRSDPSLTIDMTTDSYHYAADGWWGTTMSMWGMTYELGGGVTPVTNAYGSEETYLGYFGEGDKETIKFTSDKAVKAEIVVLMGSNAELPVAGTMNIKLNETLISLEDVTLPEPSQQYATEFHEVSLGKLDLNSGENTLVFDMLGEAAPFLDEVVIYANNEAKVELVAPAEQKKIGVLEETLSIIEGESTIIATDTTDVTFVSSDETIVTVDQTGNVTAVATGKANITIKKDDYYSVRIAVTVNPKPVEGQIVVEAESGVEEEGEIKAMAPWGDAVVSGDKYIYTFPADQTLTLKFESTKAQKMTLSVVGTAIFSTDTYTYVDVNLKEVYTIKVNDVEVDLTEKIIPAGESSGYTAEFKEVVLGDVDVKEGENTIVVTSIATGAPLDCFKLTPKE